MSKPKLYLNENLSWRIARALRGYGYDVISSHEVEMNAEPDDTQLAFAVEQQRAVVTNNFRDFVELHHQYAAQQQDHYGVVLTTKIPLSLMIHRLRQFFQCVSADELINQIRWLNEFE
jgi:uncharacterized protein with PIN domain